jgi:hypothetical protein
MFYICIPSNIISIPDVWDFGYINVLVDGIKINIKIKSFSFVIKCDNKNYYMYKIYSTITSGTSYKIETLTNKKYLITNNYNYITCDNNNTFYIYEHFYDNGIATIYHDKSEMFIKIGETVVEADLQN